MTIKTEKEKREQWERRCYGTTQARVEREFQESIHALDGARGRLMWAMCLLSDSQEAAGQGDSIMAGRWINQAKYHIDIVRVELRKDI